DGGGPRRRHHLSHRLRVLDVRVDRRDDDAGLNGDEVDAHQRDTHPCVDDDSFVEYPIEDIDQTRAAGCPFNWHRSSSWHTVASVTWCGPGRGGRKAGASPRSDVRVSFR